MTMGTRLVTGLLSLVVSINSAKADDQNAEDDIVGFFGQGNQKVMNVLNNALLKLDVVPVDGSTHGLTLVYSAGFFAGDQSYLVSCEVEGLGRSVPKPTSCAIKKLAVDADELSGVAKFPLMALFKAMQTQQIVIPFPHDGCHTRACLQ